MGTKFLKQAKPVLEEDEKALRQSVEDILERVRKEGDAALAHYSKTFDQFDFEIIGINPRNAPVVLAALYFLKLFQVIIELTKVSDGIGVADHLRTAGKSVSAFDNSEGRNRYHDCRTVA